MFVDKQSLIPTRFVQHALHTFQLEPNEQHDINELWMMVLDKISSENKTHLLEIDDVAKPCDDMSGLDKVQAIYKIGANAWKKYHVRGFSDWDRLTEGLQIHQVQCTQCKKCFHNFEPFTVMNIAIDPDADVFRITDGIRHFFSTEQIKEWTCDQCKVAHPADKVVRMWKLPQVLTIVLKRFDYTPSGTMRKIRTPVKIPKKLTFTSEIVLGGGGDTYALRSIALHHGFMQFGHYTSIANYKNEWYHYDDLNINKVDIHKVCERNPDAYVLMYEKSSP